MHANPQPAMHAPSPRRSLAPSSPGMLLLSLHRPPSGPSSPGTWTPPASPTPPTTASPSSASSSSSPPVAIHQPPSPSNTHSMQTRAKRGLFQPTDRLNLSATHTSPSPIPKTYQGSLQDPHWRRAMREEFDALVHNRTWTLFPRPSRANIVSGKWIYKHKFHSDGSLARYKARWVVRGFSQQPGIDFDETFNPVVKPTTIRIVLSIAVSRSWPVHQLDVKNAFLHGNLDEEVYCQQPSGFINARCPEYVCRLHKSLYGLKQPPPPGRGTSCSPSSRIGLASSPPSQMSLCSSTRMARILPSSSCTWTTSSSPAPLPSFFSASHSSSTPSSP
jgi:hypothetical protein